MPQITLQDVQKTAALAKLEFSQDELEKFTSQFSKIIGFVDKIGELNTDNIPPTTHAVEKSNVFRKDIVLDSMQNDEIGKIAPKFIDGNIVVPKIIEY